MTRKKTMVMGMAIGVALLILAVSCTSGGGSTNPPPPPPPVAPPPPVPPSPPPVPPPPPPNAPATPSNFTATPTSSTSIRLTWTAPSGATGYLLERKTGSGNYIVLTPPTASPYDDTAVSANTKYDYRLKATNSAGESPAAETSATTPVVGPTVGDLTINVSGLPAGVAANIAVTGPNSYVKVISATTTLTTLPVGTYSIEPGFVTSAGSTYSGAPTIQQAIVSGTPAQATVTYSNYTDMNLVVSGTTCVGVPVGTSCTLTLEPVNNTSAVKWSILQSKLNGIGNFTFVDRQLGPVLTACGLIVNTLSQGAVLSILTTCGGTGYSGNGVLAKFTLQRKSAGLTRIAVKDSQIATITNNVYPDTTLFFFE